jgi:uncharacterized protein
MAHRAPEPVPQIGTLVIQPTPFCNINCTYCYLPERTHKAVITLETVQILFEKVFASGWLAPELTVIWHAGEPLVMQPDFYESCFTAIEALRPPAVRMTHSIQTNGMLISPAWCALFKKWNVGVGVSIDGPRRFNDEHRLTRDGRSTFDRTVAGIRTLRDHNVPFHVISVLTEKSLDAPAEMLEFYLGEQIEDVCFNVEESEGEHVSGLFASSSPRERFQAFLQEFWHLARKSGRIRFIREIDGMLPRVFRPGAEQVRNIQTEPFGMLNVDCHGNVSSFSPELLGLKSSAYGDFLIGNIRHSSLEAMRASPVMQSLSRDIAAGVAACRESCEYYSVCGGGAPINKLAENGSFASTATSFCTLTQMVPADLILTAFEDVQRTLDTPDAARLVASVKAVVPEFLKTGGEARRPVAENTT